MIKKLLTLSLALASVPAFATHYSGNRTYFTQYDFSAQAFGKQVKSVIVHTGVLERGCSGESYWSDVKNVPMERHGNHFNARAMVTGATDSGCTSANGAIAQYWVTFEDGSTLITTPA